MVDSKRNCRSTKCFKSSTKSICIFPPFILRIPTRSQKKTAARSFENLSQCSFPFGKYLKVCERSATKADSYEHIIGEAKSNVEIGILAEVRGTI